MELENKHFTITENAVLNFCSYNLGENFFDIRLGYCRKSDYFCSTGNTSSEDLLGQDFLHSIIQLD